MFFHASHFPTGNSEVPCKIMSSFPTGNFICPGGNSDTIDSLLDSVIKSIEGKKEKGDVPPRKIKSQKKTETRVNRVNLLRCQSNKKTRVKTGRLLMRQ